MSSDPNADGLAGRQTSIWLDRSEGTDYDPLDRGVRADVAVIGGGIAGLTTATELAEAGESVALIERDRILTGVTGHTTAKVTSQHGLVYDTIRESFGREGARAYAGANEAAIDRIERRVEESGVDCGFERLPSYAYVTSSERREKVRAEVDAAQAAGLPAEYVEEVPGADEATAGVRFDEQAQFHPRAYLLSLASEFVAAGGRIFEETRALDVDGGDPCRVQTDRGTVEAGSVVLATHFPIVDHAFYFARMYPKRSYVLAARVRDPPEELLYKTGSEYFSARPYRLSGDDAETSLALIGGQNHKTGQGGSTADRYRNLERAARERFDVESIEYRWSTQDYVSVDKVPYVGEVGPLSRNLYVATGFGGWGMTNGTAAGRMLADQILGRSNRYADLFDPSRLNTGKSAAKELATENANVGKQLVGDWSTKPLSSAERARDLGRGEATVVRRDGDVLGIYRDEEGEIHAVDAVCPHMHCLVRWNDGERTWDCPCHGSRFECDGKVLDGPAVDDLSTRNLDVGGDAGAGRETGDDD